MLCYSAGSKKWITYGRCTLPFIIVAITAVCYFFGSSSEGEEGFLGKKYWVWCLGGVNVIIIAVWTYLLVGLKEFFDYRTESTDSTSTSAVPTQRLSVPQASNSPESLVREESPLLSPQTQPKKSKKKNNRK